MKNLLIAPVMAIASLSATAVSAQSGPDLQFSGVIMAEVLMAGAAPAEYYGYADLDLDYAFTTLSSGATVGAVLSYQGLSGSGASLNVLHAGVYLDFGNQRITAGVVEGAFATHRGISGFGSSGIFAVQMAAIFGSFGNAVQLAGLGYPVGVRYDAEFSGVEVSASYAQLDIAGTQNQLIGASGRYAFSDAFAVWGSYETTLAGGVSDARGAIGVSGNYDAFEYGMSYFRDGGTQFLDSAVSYAVNDSIDIGLGHLARLDGSNGISSLTAAYTMSDRYFVRGSVYTQGGSSSTVGTLDVGVEF